MKDDYPDVEIVKYDYPEVEIVKYDYTSGHSQRNSSKDFTSGHPDVEILKTITHLG
ncbi:MAG: hypothetical protein ACKVQV_03220 [Bacteroidia bacterium]